MPNLQRFQGLWGNSRDVEKYIFYWWKLDGVSVLSLYETLDKACVRGVGYRQRVFLVGGECLLFVLYLYLYVFVAFARGFRIEWDATSDLGYNYVCKIGIVWRQRRLSAYRNSK